MTLVLAAQAGAQEGAKILVLPFDANAQEESAKLRQSLPELLRDSMKAAGLSVVDAQTTQSVMSSRKISTLNLKTARELASQAKASFAVYGSLSKAGETISIDARLVEVGGKSGAEPLYVTKQGLINLQPAIDELTQKIKAGLYKGDKIAEIDVEGNNALDKDVVLIKLKSLVGEPYDAKTVNEDLKRLYDLGYFDDVQIRVDEVRGGKKLVFVVKEKPRIQAIGVIGASEIDKTDIIESMNTKTGGVLNLKVLADDLNKIRDLYRKKGYYSTTVNYELEQTDPRVARLNIVVKESKKSYIKEISIEGCQQLKASDVKGELALHERTVISWLTGTGVLKEEMLERDVAAIESYYANRGFVDVKVASPRIDMKDDGIYITFVVEEGSRYKVGAFALKGDLLEAPEKLMPLTKMAELSKTKQYFDRSALRDDLNVLTEYYANQGYAFAEANTDTDKHDAEKTVDVTYVISKGQKVYVRRVTIEGNDRTRDNVIRRELKLADGDLFNGSLLKKSNEKLEKLDYFEKVDIETVPTQNPNEVDLAVKVKDKNTGSISIGAGYSTSDAVFAGGSIEERNLFGKGYLVRFSGMFSWRTQRFGLTFTNPHIYDSNVGGSVDAYSVNRVYNNYNKQTTGGSVRAAYPLGEYTSVMAGYTLNRNNVTNVTWWLLQNSNYQQYSGVSWSSVGTVGLSRDTTDNPSRPTKGYNVSLMFDYSGGILGGTDDFIRPTLSMNFYYPLFFGSVFHWKGYGTVLFPNGSSVPFYEKFYLGGIQNVRGYAVDKISPRVGIYNQASGGQVQAYSNFEYIFPILKTYGVQGVAFFDAGNVWRTWENIYGGFCTSVGAGLRWYSPMGLIRVEYGYGLQAQQYHYGNPSQIGFTVGQTF